VDGVSGWKSMCCSAPALSPATHCSGVFRFLTRQSWKWSARASSVAACATEGYPVAALIETKGPSGIRRKTATIGP